MSLNDSGQDDGACGTLNRDPVHRAICAGAQAGIAFAVSAGNASQDFVGTIPSNYDEVLTVTAMNDYDGAPGGNAAPRCAAPSPNPDDAPASYSNYTTGFELAHTVAAPGTCLQSLYPGDRYAQGLLGTSFAAPHGAGVAALCISTGGCSGLNGSQIASKLHNDAVAYNNANPKYGFTGDLLRPLGDGRIYGPLIHAGSY